MIQRKLTSTVLVDALAALTMALLYIMLSQARRVKNSGKYDAVIKFWRRNNIATMEYQIIWKADGVSCDTRKMLRID